jgi:hypothetical protein
MDVSVATPFFVTGDHNLIAEVVGQETSRGFQPGPVFTHGTMLFDGDQLQPMHVPAGACMIHDNAWDARHFSLDEAACVAIGDVRARFPVLFELMKNAGAPLAQIAREILKKEHEGIYYYIHVFQVDRATGQTRNYPAHSATNQG